MPKMVAATMFAGVPTEIWIVIFIPHHFERIQRSFLMAVANLPFARPLEDAPIYLFLI